MIYDEINMKIFHHNEAAYYTNLKQKKVAAQSGQTNVDL
jgi:hypothetical protein